MTMHKKPLIMGANATMEIDRFPWCRVSPLSLPPFLREFSCTTLFQKAYKYGYNSTTFKSLGLDIR